MSSNEDDLKKNKKPCFKTLKEYSASSTTHGISYVFEDDRLLIERFLWVIVIIIAIYIAASFSIDAYVNWQENPVLTSVGTTGHPIEKVEFPAITICAQGSAKEVIDAAFFKQFNDYLKALNKVYSDLTPEEIVRYGKAFLAEKYPGAKVTPNNFVSMMSSPNSDADTVMKSSAIFNPQPACSPSNSASSSSSTSTTVVKTTIVTNKTVVTKGKRSIREEEEAEYMKRKKRWSSYSKCPDNTWLYNYAGSCFHFRKEGALSHADATAYCNALTTGLYDMETHSATAYVGFWNLLAPKKCKFISAINIYISICLKYCRILEA